MMQVALRAVPEEPLTRPGAPPGMYASAYRSLAAVAGGLAQARLRLLHNNTAGALDVLREAATVEDSLGYMEPPRWGRGWVTSGVKHACKSMSVHPALGMMR
jgi:hypothetical protein